MSKLATSGLVLGLLIFLGTHSVRIVADNWRSACIARIGPLRWKAIYSVLSGLGLGLIVWAYAAGRAEPTLLWQAPLWSRHLAALLTLPAFVLIAAAYVPGTRIKAWLGHPMVAGIGLWALAHLLANGSLADLLLFGGFLAWAVVDFASARARDARAGTRYATRSILFDGIAVAAGVVAWAVFARFLHTWWIGVQPFG